MKIGGLIPFSVQQVFSLIIALPGVLGILGASRLDMTRGPNLGPGAGPMVYSIVLTLLAVRLFLAGRGEAKIVWRDLAKPPVRDGWVFYAFLVLIMPLMVIFGTMPSIFLFSFSALMYLKRISLPKNIVFSLCLVITFHLLFARLLGIPFESGIVFGQR